MRSYKQSLVIQPIRKYNVGHMTTLRIGMPVPRTIPTVDTIFKHGPDPITDNQSTMAEFRTKQREGELVNMWEICGRKDRVRITPHNYMLIVMCLEKTRQKQARH